MLVSLVSTKIYDINFTWLNKLVSVSKANEDVLTIA